MKWNVLLRKDGFALLQSENDTQYAVVSEYDPTQPEDQQWNHGTYFAYFADRNRKVICLQKALDTFRYKTESDYITRDRLIELATKFKDLMVEEEFYLNDIFTDECEMTSTELNFFGVPCEREEEDDESK